MTRPTQRAPLFPYTTLFRSEPQHGRGDRGGGERLRDRAAGAAHDGVLLHRDDELVLARHARGELGVERLHEAHVDDRGVERDRKSTRLNSSHPSISYAVFCLNDPTDTASSSLSLHDALPI